MGTRSFIHVHMSDGRWGRIYCHWDGYWSWNGKLLFEHYNSQELAEALIGLGDLSSLKEEIGVKHDFDAPHSLPPAQLEKWKETFGKMCTAYGRDRGEKDVSAVFGASLEEVFETEEYMYVWRDGQWWGMSYTDDLNALRPLVDILVEEKIIERPVEPVIRKRYRPEARAIQL